MSTTDLKDFAKNHFYHAIYLVLLYSMFVSFTYLVGFYGQFKFNILPYLSFWDVLRMSLFALCEAVLRLFVVILAIYIGYTLCFLYKNKMKYAGIGAYYKKKSKTIYQIFLILLVFYPFLTFFLGVDDAKKIYDNKEYFVNVGTPYELKLIGYANGKYFFVDRFNKNIKIVGNPPVVSMVKITAKQQGLIR